MNFLHMDTFFRVYGLKYCIINNVNDASRNDAGHLPVFGAEMLAGRSLMNVLPLPDR